jgi:tetraacyldisaccharide 4'-kinase
MALRVLSGGTWLGLQANLAVYAAGLRRQVGPECPVLVVGNLTLGGTGKTTATTYLVRRLAQAGVRAGVVLRGYRRKSGLPPLLVSDGSGALASPAEAGDEAYLLAALLRGHPVAVGVRRETVARMLLERTAADALVLDDGFQYFRLARTADIVLVDASHQIERDRLFPAGTLREPAHHLRRASQVWITHAEMVAGDRVERLAAWIRDLVPAAPVVIAEHRAGALRSIGTGARPNPGARVLALSALGNPRSFEAGLERLGYEVRPLAFADHHRYVPSDWDRVRRAAESSGADWVITTEKDAVKLPDPPTESPPVCVLGCELGIIEGREHIDSLVEAVSGGSQAAENGGLQAERPATPHGRPTHTAASGPAGRWGPRGVRMARQEDPLLPGREAAGKSAGGAST